MFHNVKRWGNMDNSHLRVISLEMDGWMDGLTDNVKTVYPTTNKVCGGYNKHFCKVSALFPLWLLRR